MLRAASNTTLPIREPTLNYRSDYLDAYYDPSRQDKCYKPLHDLVVRGLFRPHENTDADKDSLPLLR